MRASDDIEEIRKWFLSTHSAPSSPSITAEHLARVLEGQLFKQQIFANSWLAIIDQSQMKYLYVSGAVKDYTGYDADDLMEKGVGAYLSLVEPEDLKQLLSIFNRVLPVVLALPIQQRLYFHFYYSCRIRGPKGTVCVYQQTIPLALNDNGEPYLMMAQVSNVTEFKKDTAVHFSCVLKEPGQPVRTLVSGTSPESEALLTNRERAIVQCLADGKDSQDIADQLFISHATVRTHRKNILQKTGAKNVANLVQLALANGWI